MFVSEEDYETLTRAVAFLSFNLRCRPSGITESITHTGSPEARSGNKRRFLCRRLLPQRFRRLCSSSSQDAKRCGAVGGNGSLSGWKLFLFPARSRNVQPPWWCFKVVTPMKSGAAVFWILLLTGAVVYFAKSPNERGSHSSSSSVSAPEPDDDEASGDTTDNTFHGYDCTLDCSGHEAGYRWAEEHNITDEEDCGGNS